MTMAEASEASATARRAGLVTLSTVTSTARWECAVVYTLSVDCSAYVESLRGELSFPAPDEFQLMPHLTLLYVGLVPGSLLLRLARKLAISSLGDVQVETGPSIGTFPSTGRISNVHLSVVQEQAVRAVHSKVFHSFRDEGWIPQTDTVLDRYVPHISIFDRVDLGQDARQRISEVRPTQQRFVLRNPAWMGIRH